MTEAVPAQPTPATPLDATLQPQGKEQTIDSDDSEWEATINGEKQKVSRKKLLSDYQKYHAADKRLKDASERSKTVDQQEAKLRQFLSGAQKNPKHVLSKLLGGEEQVKKFAEDYLWDQIQREKKSPQELEMEQLKQWKYEQEQAQEHQQLTAEEEAQQGRVQELKVRYDKMFSEALQKTNMPKTAETVERMSKTYMAYLRNGYEPTMDEVMGDVEESYLGDIKGLLGNVSGEKLYKMFGEDLWKKAREYDVSRLTQKPAQAQGQPQQNANAAVAKQDDRMSLHDAKALWRKRAGV